MVKDWIQAAKVLQSIHRLENFLEQSPTLSGRNFRGVALQVHEILETEDSEDGVALITKHHLETALRDYLAARKDVEHIDPYESHWDRQERLHQERLRQMELQFEQQLRTMLATQISNNLSSPQDDSVCNITN